MYIPKSEGDEPHYIRGWVGAVVGVVQQEYELRIEGFNMKKPG